MEDCLTLSQLRQTCNKFGENTIEAARRLRLAQFIEDMEKILDGLVLSLSCVTSLLQILAECFSSGTLRLNRSSPTELYNTQCQAEKTLSDLRHVLNHWATRIEEVRAQQESKLNEALLRFEQAAKKGANDAIELSVASLPLVCTFDRISVLCIVA